ncbi:uncharacterized protein JCM6883_006349 [Sporobolomyces salmoneus]|uniref:uncharacterized protein n=1 Tax=Sporobolomyces salmoneus TaxID=183962 RepID=UPI003171478C
MALTPKSAAVFLLDCSASMNNVVTFKDRTDDHATSRDRPSLEVMKEYVKAKIVQRIMRDLRTIPIAVLAFGYPKTKNIMTTRAKEAARENGEPFDRQNDGYRGIYELVPLTFNPDQSTLERIDLAVAGQGQDGDAHTALMAAIETLEAQGSINKYATKEIFILTDGESTTDWDEWKSTVQGLKARGMAVKVIGVNFDDEEMEYVEEDKSETKRENETMFHKLVKKLRHDEVPPRSIVANAVSAVAAITAPILKSTNSRADKMTLKLGDPEGHPDQSLVMFIDVKKAVVPAAIPSMKKMSLAGFDRIQQNHEASQRTNGQGFSLGGGTKRGHDEMDELEQVEEEEEDEVGTGRHILSKEEAAERFNQKQRASLFPAREGTSMGKIGANLEKTLRSAGLQEADDEDADLASHDVTIERRYFYRPSINPKKLSSTVKVKQKTILGGDSDEEEVAGGGGKEEAEEEERKEIGDDADLVDAYFYGGDLIPFGDYDETFGKLAGLNMGMEVISFMKSDDVRYDWRMGDVFYVYASIGQSGSEKLFSAFVNGMEERKACAVVRFVKKGFNSSKTGTHVMPDPQVGILFPATDRETKSEFCYYIRLPFGEDIRSPGFPSLSHLFNRKGEPITSHPLLPTKAQDQAMDNFVDAMSLDKLADVTEDGEVFPWLNIYDSYSPAIHNIQNTLMYRLTNPEGELPPVPSSLTCYLDPPRALVESAVEAKEAVVEEFKVKIVPPKPKKTTKANENYVQPEDEKAAAAYAALFPSTAEGGSSKVVASKAPRVSQVKVSATGLELKDSQNQSQSRSQAPVPVLNPVVEEQQDQEMEEEEEEPATEDSENDDEDATFGTTPETSFATSSKSSAGVSQLVDNACRLIETSFSTQNFSKATAELAKARSEAMKRNDPSSYNSALRTFASKLHSHKHRDYLQQIEVENLGLLIGNGTTENDAEDFLEALT